MCVCIYHLFIHIAIYPPAYFLSAIYFLFVNYPLSIYHCYLPVCLYSIIIIHIWVFVPADYVLCLTQSTSG